MEMLKICELMDMGKCAINEHDFQACTNKCRVYFFMLHDTVELSLPLTNEEFEPETRLLTGEQDDGEN